jgi:hypothetical protein
MKSLILVIFGLLSFQEDPPYKPTDEFELKLDFEFKDRGAGRDPNKIEMNQTLKEREKSRGSGLLPYLYLNLRVTKQSPSEVRVKIIENSTKNILNHKKFNMSTVLKLDLGFTDDIKDRVGAYEYTVYFLDEEKDPVSKIVIYFEQDGTYLVNGETRGKI